MPTVTDQTGRSLEVPEFPERIISLVPSQTELLYDLGLGDRVVGITKFCVHPEEWWRNKPRVGGTKIIRHKAVQELAPDLIIANKEENTREDVEKLSGICPVWVSDVNNLPEAMRMINDIGKLTQTHGNAEKLVEKIKESYATLVPAQPKRTLYLIWRKPYMAAGQGTFINAMLNACGFINVVKEARYPELKESEIVRLAPDVVLFSSEPYPFKEQHMENLRQILPHCKMQLVDGEPFSWYGSRLQNSATYFNKLIETIG